VVIPVAKGFVGRGSGGKADGQRSRAKSVGKRREMGHNLGGSGEDRRIENLAKGAVRAAGDDDAGAAA
jgi:hypothetical protein